MNESDTHPVIGLLGGTFDPVHGGHRALADAALACGMVDQVRWIPAGHPPHRAGPAASAEHRLAMVRLMIADQPRFSLDDSEVIAAVRGEASYTVHTLERLRRELGPAQPLAWILGADAFLGLPAWHRWQDILPLTHLIVTTRPGASLQPSNLPEPLRPVWSAHLTEHPQELATQPGGRICQFPMTPVELSATELRRRLPDTTATFDGLLPPAIVRYIRHHHLYTH